MFVKREGLCVSVVEEGGRILWSGRTDILPPEYKVYWAVDATVEINYLDPSRQFPIAASASPDLGLI